MAKQALTVNVRIDGLQATLKKFRALPKDASTELRDAAQELSETIAAKARVAAVSDEAPQSSLIAPTIKARRDRVPSVQAGGTKRVGSSRVPAFKVLFGSEFGSNRYRQFQRPHNGGEGYWFFPLVEENQTEIARAWNAAADEIVDRFGEGG